MNGIRTERLLVAAEIEKNIADEATARSGYLKLLPMLLSDEDRAVIKEIIADELNHSELLRKMALVYNGIESKKD